jgi:hypothetical protein
MYCTFNLFKTIRFSNQFCARLALKFAARGAYVIFEKFFTNAIKCNQMPNAKAEFFNTGNHVHTTKS